MTCSAPKRCCFNSLLISTDLCFYQDLVEDYLRSQCLKEFAAFLVSLENPPLEFDDESGEFSAVIKSTKVSPVKESSAVAMIHLDTSEQADQEEHEVCTAYTQSTQRLEMSLVQSTHTLWTPHYNGHHNNMDSS